MKLRRKLKLETKTNLLEQLGLIYRQMYWIGKGTLEGQNTTFVTNKSAANNLLVI